MDRECFRASMTAIVHAAVPIPSPHAAETKTEVVAVKAVTWHGVGDIRLEEVPDPRIEAPTDAIIRITTSAICGTDLHLVRGTMPGLKAVDDRLLRRPAGRGRVQRIAGAVRQDPVRLLQPDSPAGGGVRRAGHHPVRHLPYRPSPPTRSSTAANPAGSRCPSTPPADGRRVQRRRRPDRPRGVSGGGLSGATDHHRRLRSRRSVGVAEGWRVELRTTLLIREPVVHAGTAAERADRLLPGAVVVGHPEVLLR